MGILDDSDSDDDTSSDEEEVKAGATGKPKADVTKYMNAKRASLGDFDAFKGTSDEDNETAAKMREILKLREALGMDKDVAFMAEQEAKLQEKKRLENMTPEERMKEQAANSGDMMARIRAKQEELAKKKAEDATAEVGEEEEAEVKPKKEKKKKKKKDKKKEEE
ncbi:expressed unknown protein [Seminavis robusta]|uniref:Uncharacterized protein n=1 Tax=Seminavis robusta TaxID=568900 RepID=A0A9N8D6T5_9STRA|nr:expressed unknown protein [Seminavis robusta]|eukprot:Sro15_g011230.1 n/a (165) ;mRNA; r:105256-105750